MGRPKEFDVDTAVDAAMHAFWAGGYEATSTQRLCDATGLCRSSIYHTFGSKRELYERALRRYDDIYTGALVTLLRTSKPVRERIGELFDRVIDSEFAGEHGCLSMNALLELGDRDSQLCSGAREGVEKLRGELRCTLDAGQRSGEVAGDSDVVALADFIQATMNGMRMMSSAGADRAALTGIARVALRTI